MNFLLLLLIFPIAGLAQTGKATVDLNKIKAVVQRWSNAHNEKDFAAFSEVFAPKVRYYTQTFSKEACVKSKLKLLTGSDFHQDITSDMTVSVYSSGTIKCDFTKTVTLHSKTKSYPSYLLLIEDEGDYLVSGESDQITDRNLKYHLQLGEPLNHKELSIIPLNEQPYSKKPDSKVVEILYSIGKLCLIIVLIGGSLWVIYEWKVKRNRSVKNPTDLQVSFKEVNERKGASFERFIVLKFDPAYFHFVDWKGDKQVAGIYPSSNRYPDLEYIFKHKGFERPFAIECKFRTSLPNGKLELEERQLNNYRDFQNKRKIPVYVALGVGGRPESPQALYLIPLDQIKQAASALFGYKRSVHENFFYHKTMDRLI